MESPGSNPTIESIELYVKACGKTVGEFFEPLIPPDNPKYDRHVHRIIKTALENPRLKTYLRSLIGLLTEAMRHGEGNPGEQKGNTASNEKKKQRAASG